MWKAGAGSQKPINEKFGWTNDNRAAGKGVIETRLAVKDLLLLFLFLLH